ncbi:MAG: hypothetical protein Q9162_005774 [Coniocarpon cinnabarinum]
MAEEGNTSAPDVDSLSATSQPTTFPAQSPQAQSLPVNAQNAQTRTIGGFVDDDEDDDDEQEEAAAQSNGMSAESEYDPNIDGGLSTTPPQQQAPAPYSEVPAPVSPSHPESSMAFPTSTSSNANQEQEHTTADPEPAPLQTVADNAVAGGSAADPVLSPSASSHAAAAGRSSMNPTPHNASSTMSRPTTANGTGDKSATTVASSARLPSDRVGILQDRIREDPKGDTDAWLSLIEEHKRRQKVVEVRQTYDRFLATFPTNADQWTAYVNFELDQDRFAEAEAILQKCVGKLHSLGLWTTYLNYIRRRNPLTGQKAEANRKTVETVFNFILDGVGIDKDAGRLWQDYIDFLKSGPGVIGGSDWQDKQKMDTVRKAYQTAIAIPTEAVETLWKDYDKFEMDLNKMTVRAKINLRRVLRPASADLSQGRKNLQEKSADYMTARSSKITLQNMTRGLNRSTTPVLPPLSGCEGDEEYAKQIEMWNKWIAWEKDDPLALNDEGQKEAFQKRILHVYNQATMSLRFWPQIWFEAAQYCYETEQTQKGDEYLDQGFEANPESCLLAFKKGERIESTTTNNDTEESIQDRGAKVRTPYDTCLDTLYSLVTKNTEREQTAIAQVKEKFASMNGSAVQPTENAEDEQDEQSQAQDPNTELKHQVEVVSRAAKEQEELLKRLINSTWTALMRAMRRVQGKGNPNAAIKGMRGVLVDARRRGRLNGDFYLAAALLEHHCYNDPTAGKIFERGLKLFPHDEKFAMEFLKYQMNTNDMTNGRATFATIVKNLTQPKDQKLSPAEKLDMKARAKAVFALFHHYETRYGELEQIRKLEQRMNTLYPEDPKLLLFEQRFSKPEFDPCSVHPVISPQTQTRAKIQNLIEQITKQEPSPHGSPRMGLAQFGNGNERNKRSPKRPLDDSDAEAPARKIARGESPLKGAAGRRLDAARKTGLANEVTPQPTPAQLPPAPPPTLPPAVFSMLARIPPAHTYQATRFDPQKMVQLLRTIDLTRVNPNILRSGQTQQQMPMPPLAAPAYAQTPNPQAFYQPTPQANYGHQGYYAPPSAYGFPRA